MISGHGVTISLKSTGVQIDLKKKKLLQSLEMNPNNANVQNTYVSSLKKKLFFLKEFVITSKLTLSICKTG